MNSLERLVQRRHQSHNQLIDLLQDADLIGQRVQISSAGKTKIHGETSLDFVNSDYLSLSKHPHVIKCAMMAAKQAGISAGMPRFLGRNELFDILESSIAQLVGQEKAAVFSSTTHIAVDVLPLLADTHGIMLVDDWAYPISLEGVYSALRRGSRLQKFMHNDPDALEHVLRSHRNVRDKVIVCDGVYSAGGNRAALKEFFLLAEKYDAVIYVDDAHGIGILGEAPENNPPYGRGGRGTLLFEKTPIGGIVHVASFSKAFGVPLAFVAGPAKFIDFLNQKSKSFVHSSQPALPIVAAAIAALQVNRVEGDALRQKLVRRVKQFISGFEGTGAILARNNFFSIQSLYYPAMRDAFSIAKYLRRNGIWSLLQLSPIDFPTGGALRFVIRALHEEAEIQQVHDILHFINDRRMVEVRR